MACMLRLLLQNWMSASMSSGPSVWPAMSTYRSWGRRGGGARGAGSMSGMSVCCGGCYTCCIAEPQVPTAAQHKAAVTQTAAHPVGDLALLQLVHKAQSGSNLALGDPLVLLCRRRRRSGQGSKVQRGAGAGCAAALLGPVRQHVVSCMRLPSSGTCAPGMGLLMQNSA